MLDVQLALVIGSRPQRFQMRRPQAVVGRKKGCDLRIPSSEVSRRHCIFRIERGCVTVEDLGSANGTFLNEERVNGRRVVRPGDHIRIGPMVFVAEYQMSQQGVEDLAHREMPPEVPIEDGVDVELVGDMGHMGEVGDMGETPPAVAIDDVEVVEDEEGSGPIPVESRYRLPAAPPSDDALTENRPRPPAPDR